MKPDFIMGIAVCNVFLQFLLQLVIRKGEFTISRFSFARKKTPQHARALQVGDK